MQTRNDKRKDFTNGTRITLSEQDLDKHDGRFDAISRIMTGILLLFVGAVLSAVVAIIVGG